MKKTFLISALAVAGLAQAQYYVSDFTLNPTSVSNEGLVVGGYGKDTPFIIWNPFTGEARVIGGMSSGDLGAAGPARISADGKTVIGSMWQDQIEVPTSWTKTFYDKFPYRFRFAKKGSDFNLFIAGVSEDGESSYVLKSSNNGNSWVDNMDPFHNIEGAVTCLSCMNSMRYVLGTDKGKLYTSTGSPCWSEATLPFPEGAQAVKSILALDFVRNDAPDNAPMAYGAIGVRLENDECEVWYTTDAGDTFERAEWDKGTPSCITHFDETLFLTTIEGGIFSSVDQGATWQSLYNAEGVPFTHVSFNDDQKGIAIAGQLAIITTDGGIHWKTAIVEGGGISPFETSDDNVWNNVIWTNGTIALAGNNGRFYTSTDDGKTFTRQYINGGENSDNYTLATFDRNVFNLIADGSAFYRKTIEPYVQGYGPGRYDVENDIWTPMPNFGIISDNNVASTWGISDDATYAAGILHYFNDENKKVGGGAAMWDENGVHILNNIPELSGHSSRANRINNDGSVIVGFVDNLGPWLASIWRRQADGEYTQQILMKDPSKTIEDVDLDDFNDVTENFLGNALALSRNGKWVGGTGGTWYAVDGAWIWSEESGLIELDAPGATVEVAEDGSMAVGRGDGGLGAWIWTQENGYRELNQYAVELGGDLKDTAICGFYAMSPNGRFLTGYAYDNEMQPHGYMLDLYPETNDIESLSLTQVKASVYPNPVVSELHVDLPYDNQTIKTSITLYNMQGSVCRTLTDCHQSNVINVEGLNAGIYLLDVRTDSSNKIFKVIVK